MLRWEKQMSWTKFLLQTDKGVLHSSLPCSRRGFWSASSGSFPSWKYFCNQTSWIWGPNHGISVSRNNVSLSRLLFPGLELAVWLAACCEGQKLCAKDKAAGQRNGATGRKGFPIALLSDKRYLPMLTKEWLASLCRILLRKWSCTSVSCMWKRKHRLEA